MDSAYFHYCSSALEACFKCCKNRYSIIYRVICLFTCQPLLILVLSAYPWMEGQAELTWGLVTFWSNVRKPEESLFLHFFVVL